MEKRMNQMRALGGLLLACLSLPATAETFRLRAPAEALEAVIRADDTLTLEVRYRGRIVVRTPAVGLEVDGHLRANALPRLSGSARRKVDETIRPAVPEKRAVIPDRYNELRLSFGPKLAVTVRAYDDGVAYRFETAIDGEVIVRNESAGLRLGVGDSIWIALVNCRNEPGVDCFQSSYEENYQQLAAQAVPDGRLGYLPITVQTAGARRRNVSAVAGNARIASSKPLSARISIKGQPGTSRSRRRSGGRNRP